MNPNPLNQRPTQAPLDREGQQKAFQNLHTSYFSHQTPAPIPQFPYMPQKIEKPITDIQLKEFQEKLAERGITETVKKVEEQRQENKTAATVKQFYCRHVFTPVRATFMSLPIHYKICNKCSLVK